MDAVRFRLADQRYCFQSRLRFRVVIGAPGHAPVSPAGDRVKEQEDQSDCQRAAECAAHTPCHFSLWVGGRSLSHQVYAAWHLRSKWSRHELGGRLAALSANHIRRAGRRHWCRHCPVRSDGSGSPGRLQPSRCDRILSVPRLCGCCQRDGPARLAGPATSRTRHTRDDGSRDDGQRRDHRLP
jgi:hypothetical protein